MRNNNPWEIIPWKSLKNESLENHGWFLFRGLVVGVVGNYDDVHRFSVSATLPTVRCRYCKVLHWQSHLRVILEFLRTLPGVGCFPPTLLSAATDVRKRRFHEEDNGLAPRRKKWILLCSEWNQMSESANWWPPRQRRYAGTDVRLRLWLLPV